MRDKFIESNDYKNWPVFMFGKIRLAQIYLQFSIMQASLAPTYDVQLLKQKTK